MIENLTGLLTIAKMLRAIDFTFPRVKTIGNIGLNLSGRIVIFAFIPP